MSDRYKNEAQQRILHVLLALARAGFQGMSNAQLAESLDLEPYTVTRDLRNLQAIRLVEKNGKYWSLTDLLPQTLGYLLQDYQEAKRSMYP